jgi:hypothetical protein
MLRTFTSDFQIFPNKFKSEAPASTGPTQKNPSSLCVSDIKPTKATMSNVISAAIVPIPSLLSHDKLSSDAILQQLLKEIGLAEDDINTNDEPFNGTVTTDIIYSPYYDVDLITPRFSCTPDTVPIESPIGMPKESVGPTCVDVDTIGLNVPDPLKPQQQQLSSSCDGPMEVSRQDRNLVPILPKLPQQGIQQVVGSPVATATRMIPRNMSQQQRPPLRFNAITEQEERRYMMFNRFDAWLCWVAHMKVTTQSQHFCFCFRYSFLIGTKPLCFLQYYYYPTQMHIYNCCRERNRYHAHQSRMRRKSLTHDFQTQIVSLREENAKLRKLIGEDQAMAALEKMRLKSHQCFIQALQKPQNRRLRKRAVNFLKKLPKDMVIFPDNNAA